jgi:hypothetical protein
MLGFIGLAYRASPAVACQAGRRKIVDNRGIFVEIPLFLRPCLMIKFVE